MTTQTIETVTNVKVTINGESMKELKNLVKKHKHNKKYPVLANIKIDILDYDKIKATHINVDYDREVKTEKVIEVLHNDANTGTFLIPADMIKRITGIKKTSVYSFEIMENGKINFNNNGISQMIQSSDPEGFMKSQQHENIQSHGAIDYNDLQKIKDAAISTSKSETRPILMNVLIRNNHVYSTDSHRLYKSTMNNVQSERDILINKLLIDTMIANENKKDFTATIKTNDTHIIIETHNTTYTATMTAGNYPDVSRLLPDNFNQVFTVNDVTFLKDVAEQIYKITKSTRNQVMYLEIVDNYTIKVNGSNNETGESLETTLDIHSDNVTPGFKMAFSSQYLLEGIKQLGNVSGVQISIMGNFRPFTVSSNDTSDTLSLILPVRTVQ